MTSNSDPSTPQDSAQPVAVAQMQGSEDLSSAPVPSSSGDPADTALVSVTDAPKSVTLTEFTLFPELPSELKLMVWKYAVLERMILVGASGSRFNFNLQITTMSSAISQTSKESRQVFLENSELCCLDADGHLHGRPALVKPFYFNFARDVVSLSGRMRKAGWFLKESRILHKLKSKASHVVYNIDRADRRNLHYFHG
jgi:hypothetical protein